MNDKSNRNITANAQTLRRDMTKEERHLWYDFLKRMRAPVHRQKVIGRYIVDFYIAAANLVIELDGSQHYEPENAAADAVRDTYLRGLGLLVLRYSNSDINDQFEAVCRDILERMKQNGVVPAFKEPKASP